MMRQYFAQRRRGGHNPLGVGVIAAGAILYLQDEDWWRDRFRGGPVCREPSIVELFLNGTIGASRRGRETGHWESTYAARRSDMAIVRSLRTQRRRAIAVRTLQLHDDLGLGVNSAYPSLPDLRFYRAGSAASGLPARMPTQPDAARRPASTAPCAVAGAGDMRAFAPSAEILAARR